jgi:serine protease SohB
LEFLYEYGLFLAKAVTIVVSIALVIGLAIGAASKNKGHKKGELSIENLSEDLKEQLLFLKRALLNKDELKAFDKEQKKAQKKSKDDEADSQPKLFVIEFDGDVHANEVEAFREEITAVITIAKPEDKVLIKLESPGGVVHGYGLAASQIARLKSAKIHTTVAVDKVAASGGYMMACVADKIVAAPFSIIGSIGVVAQLPNINKLLKKNDIEVEQHTAGEFKRTLTVMGENTEEGREKFKQELEETHVLFKQFVSDHRPDLDINKVATGEHWYATQAKELGLVDEIKTSDDFILEKAKDNELYKVEYKIRKNVAEKLGIAASVGLTKTWNKLANFHLTSAK